MPIKDPEERRAYQAALMRERRARAKRGEIAKPTPAKGRRKPTCDLGEALTEALALADAPTTDPALDPATWEQSKAALGWRMILRARKVLDAMDASQITAGEALKLIQAGTELVESALATIRAEDGDGPELDYEAFIRSSGDLASVTEMLRRYARPGGEGNT